jgi:putative MATE family efflux protein
MGAEPEVVGPAAAFLRIVLLGAPLGLPMLIANGILRGTGNTGTPMRITAAMNAVNISVSAVLAFGWFGAPEMGLLGVATGTAVARLFGGAVALGILEWGRAGMHLPLSELITLRRRPLARVWRLAAPAMLERGLNSVSHIVFLAIVAVLGTTTLAAHSIGIHVESLAFMAAAGLSSAIAALVGQSIGAQLPALAEQAIRRALFGLGAAMGVLGLLFILFAPWGVKAFGATPEVLRLAGMALQIGGLELVPMASAIILTGALNGAGDTRSPLIVMILCTVTIRFGVVYLFAVTFGWGLAGVWLGTTLFWIVRMAGLLWVVRRGGWKEIHAREALRFAPGKG